MDAGLSKPVIFILLPTNRSAPEMPSQVLDQPCTKSLAIHVCSVDFSPIEYVNMEEDWTNARDILMMFGKDGRDG